MRVAGFTAFGWLQNLDSARLTRKLLQPRDLAGTKFPVLSWISPRSGAFSRFWDRNLQNLDFKELEGTDPGLSR